MNIIVGAFLLSLLSAISFANDGYSAVGAGGIEFKKSEDIVMKSEVLTISKDKISVKYEFLNENEKEAKATVAFPLPKITCGYWGKNKTIDDFATLVDGKSVKMKLEEKAFEPAKRNSPGNEITKKVIAAGLPADCRKTYEDKNLFKKAQKANLADDYKGEDPEDVKYETQLIYYWEQTFPPKKIITIEHSYTPITGMGVSGLAESYFNRSLHWDRSINLRWEKIAPQLERAQSDIERFDVVEYILMTANTWKSSISDFKLILKREKPSVFIGSTLGPLTKIDENTYQFRATSFFPDRNLTVIFGNSANGKK